jgi:replicative DNA helicase
LVEREAIRRQHRAVATQIAKLAYTENREVDDLLGEANKALLAAYRDRHHSAQTLAQATEGLIDRIRYMQAHPEEFMGVPTGFIDLDHLLGGLMGGDLVLAAGRPGTGKTALMVQIAKYAAAPVDAHGNPKTPKRCAIYSLEMDDYQIAMRALAADAVLDVRKLRLAQVNEDELGQLVRLRDRYGGYELFIDDTPALTPSQLRAKTARLEAEHGPLDLIVVDYLQIMGSDDKAENRTQQIGQISRALKELARERKAVVLAGAQLKREVEHRADKKPVLADLREGGSQEQDSDIVILMSRDEQPNIVNLDVAKFRNGATGLVSLYFNGPYTRFENTTVGTVDLNAVP